ncbi:uncharacterized protein [Halyomorpha halys]|uniref:uncharacterized protein n=1 Tax=Halyomorpha halys TaxID=286706 RepID=UPI0034D1A776
MWDAVAPKPRRPPPIVINPPMSQAQLKRMLATIGISNFSINNSAKETRVYLTTEDDSEKARGLFRTDEEVQFHTYAPRGTKRSKKYVIYGFDRDYPIEDITDTLKMRLPGFKMARRLTRRDETGGVYETEMIQIITDHTVRIVDIEKLGDIDHVRFRVSTFKEDGSPVQCRNCQGFGHTMKYCGRTRLCAWCGGKHQTSECPKTQKPRCSNCDGDHPASARDCPKRVKLMEKRRQKATPGVAPTIPLRNPSRLAQPGVFYSGVMGGNNGTKGTTPKTDQPQPTQPEKPPASPTLSDTLVNQLVSRMDQMMGMVTTLLNMMGKILEKHYG